MRSKILLAGALAMAFNTGQAQTDLLLTGIFDGPLSSAPRGVEVYVLNDVADLSLYGLGSANNGGGTDGEEFSFPSVGVTAGDYIYVSNDSAAFVDFFGFSPNYTNGVSGISGDDAFELFFNGSVVDVFGEISVDGSGQPWEYTDGWAYRDTCTGPDGTVFISSNWSYSGIDVFDGDTLNATSANAFPLGTYSASGCASDPPPAIVITEIMYNPPQLADIEFIELYNNDVVAIDLAGFYFSSGIADTLPSIIMNPGDYVVITDEAPGFLSSYGFAADHEWVSGTLSNSGESIILVSPTNEVVDIVAYDDTSPWPSIADGAGPSLALCDVNADNNDVTNWQRSTTYAGFIEDGQEVYASPKAAQSCVSDPILTFEFAEEDFAETADTVSITVRIDNANATATSVDVTAIGGTAGAADYTFTTTTVTFPASSTTSQTVELVILDDGANEGNETIEFSLSNQTNSAILATDLETVTILDDDAPLDSALVLIGLFDGPFSGAPKGVEIFVRTDIADLSRYGLGCPNNGGGTDGEEYTFPAVSATAGTYIYVANDTVEFRNFFDQGADFQDGGLACNFNGDDPFELFENGQVIDVFGDIDLDGTGLPWEYTDSWAHRVSGTNPDGTTFILSNWEFGPLDVFDGTVKNDSAAVPYPIFVGVVDCSTDVAPTNPTHTMGASSFTLTWDAVPQSVACQVKGTRIFPLPAASPSVNILGFEQTTTNVPFNAAGAGSTWSWTVRCACNTSPVEATPFSVADTFTVPTPRVGLTLPVADMYPNPASHMLSMDWHANQEGPARLEVIDLLGRTAMLQNLEVQQGAQTVRLDVSGLEIGSYLILIDGVEASRFDVMR